MTETQPNLYFNDPNMLLDLSKQMPVKGREALRRSDILFLGQLVNLTEEEFLNLEYAGPASLENMKHEMNEWGGYRFRAKDEPKITTFEKVTDEVKWPGRSTEWPITIDKNADKLLTNLQTSIIEAYSLPSDAEPLTTPIKNSLKNQSNDVSQPKSNMKGFCADDFKISSVYHSTDILGKGDDYEGCKSEMSFRVVASTAQVASKLMLMNNELDLEQDDEQKQSYADILKKSTGASEALLFEDSIDEVILRYASPVFNKMATINILEAFAASMNDITPLLCERAVENARTRVASLQF